MPATTSAHDPRGSVVKIFSTKQRPTWIVPWQAGPVESTSGSGAVVMLRPDAACVLTAAHVVADTRYLEVQRSSDRFGGEKFPARVAAICHEADLALLVVEDKSALAVVAPLEVAPGNELPNISDKVRVVGYPVGGAACSVTEGTVSRVEVQDYSHSMRSGLALTVDAAINSGNSGGPLIDAASQLIVGVAIQKMVARGVELQGHAVPAPMVRRFLDEAAANLPGPGLRWEGGGGPYRVLLPTMGCALQTLESPALRRSLGLEEGLSGVLVSSVTGSGPTELRAGDVLLSFDGHNLDNLGFCDVLGKRLHFGAARDLRAVGDRVKLRVWRGGRAVEVEQPLAPALHLVPRGQYDQRPPFYICGGLVFQPLSAEYLQGWGGGSRPSHLQDLFLRGRASETLREVVIIAQIMADEVNHGYGSGFIGAPIVKSVNGKPVRDLAHLIELVRQARQSDGPGGFLHLDTEDSRGPFAVVLPIAGLEQADKRIQRLYGAPMSSVHFRQDVGDGGAPQSKL